jgi:ABC-type phosphate/phosphonate transport system substrate-binding protein
LASAAPVASLPMYDWPEVAWANDALWQAIAERLRAYGIAAPAALDRSGSYDATWRDSGLVLSQTCGLPFSTGLRGLVKIVGTPIYEVPGCEGPYYSSMIVVRTDEPAERLAEIAARRFVYNTPDSLSGYLALGAALKEAGIHRRPAEWIESGSHRASIRTVAEGRADVAAIDALCWTLAHQYEPEAVSRLKVIGATPLRPAPPLITAVERRADEVEAIRAAIKAAIADPSTKPARQALRIGGLGMFDEWDYGPIAALGRQFG